MKNACRFAACILPPLALFLGFWNSAALSAQNAASSDGSEEPSYVGSGLEAMYADEAFRFGIEAYNRASYNEAILAFERALANRPGDARTLDWLGRAYYRTGLEDIALRQWEAALSVETSDSPAAILLRSRIEMVRNFRNLLYERQGMELLEERFVETGRYPGVLKDGEESVTVFRQPSAVLPNDDGSVWVAAYGSNEIVRLDLNGIVRDRKRGNATSGFDRPYDIVRGLDGRLYVSEFRGARVSILSNAGDWQKSFGEKGLGAGQFVAPANLAVDEAGYLYVVDYGRAKISKFTPEGEFIVSFGEKTNDFPGFLSPTGVAAWGGVVYAADSVRKTITMFDPNGEYIGLLAAEGLSAPEGIRVLVPSAFSRGEGRNAPVLLIADGNRLVYLDAESALLREAGVSGTTSLRLLSASADCNGSIFAANFDNNEVEILTSMSDVASGLFVQVNRVENAQFPHVTAEISVHDRRENPIVGLDFNNFILTEKGQPVANQTLAGAAFRSDEFAVSVLFERSPEAALLRDDCAAALRDIAAALSGTRGTLASVVSAGAIPITERWTKGNPRSLENAATNASFSALWRFDLGLRLAAGSLLAGPAKRAIFFVTTGTLGSAGNGDLAFEQYGLAELAAYLSNNDIRFYAVLIGGSAGDDKIRYLANETGGAVLPLYRREGIAPVVTSLASIPAGTYIITYDSALNSRLGEEFLPLEVEALFLERSGRDSVGYFAPLE